METAKGYVSIDSSLRNASLHRLNIIKKITEFTQYIRDEDSLHLIKKFNESVHGSESFNWEHFLHDMNNLYPGLINLLKDRYPALNETEFRVCCLTYADFSRSQTGIIMGLSPNTVQTHRSRIRKKLEIEPQGNIQTFLQSMLES